MALGPLHKERGNEFHRFVVQPSPWPQAIHCFFCHVGLGVVCQVTGQLIVAVKLFGLQLSNRTSDAIPYILENVSNIRYPARAGCPRVAPWWLGCARFWGRCAFRHRYDRQRGRRRKISRPLMFLRRQLLCLLATFVLARRKCNNFFGLAGETCVLSLVSFVLGPLLCPSESLR